MSDFFIGEIRLFPFQTVPNGWTLCNGQALQIQQNAALYSLIGIQFGGDGKTTFNLPNLNGRAIAGLNGTALGMPAQVGNTAGAETVTLTVAQIPAHTHTVAAANQQAPTTNQAANPTNSFFAATSIPTQVPNPPTAPPAMYGPAVAPMTALNTTIVGNAGGSGGHENRQPFLALSYCIATSGLYPARN
ncbi:phage tail protein [Niveispirillum sp. KHB5.9]|uniref:phage tail protein n=1 Tax=Niveispirillum sp. KHB5.9 TaxID=3400269 RepID=UPI003A84FD1E